jgi:hypothetical protein
MSLLSLFGLEMAYSSGKSGSKQRKFEDVNQFENKILQRNNRNVSGNSPHWTVDSQFWT